MVLRVLDGCGSAQGRQSVSIAVDRSGRFVLISSELGAEYVCIYDLVTGGRRTLARGGGGYHDASFSLDGRTILYCLDDFSKRQSHIWKCSVTGTNQMQLTTGPAWDSAPVFASDNRTVYFVRASRFREHGTGGYVWDDLDLWRLGSNGGKARQVTYCKFYQVSQLDWISSSTLLFGATKEIPNAVFELNSNDSGIPRKLHIPGEPWFPRYDHNCQGVSFISDIAHPFDLELWTMDAHGRLEQKTHLGKYIEQALPLPKSRYLLLVDIERKLRYELWLFDANARTKRTLLSSHDLDVLGD